ncbi:MAG: septum site-determining protein MinD [SAR324 cluster bacterium]|nr:septum site-determining protein MinD [SAR324 cluster bacterium]
MGEAIVITSGKGGVGKTTSTANISVALAELGKSVVAIDGDIGLRNLDIILGLENRIVYNLVDVVKKRCRAKQALIRDKKNRQLFLLPASQVDDKSAVSPEEMKELCRELKEEFDFVLIDCPAGIEQGFKNALAGADRAIVVTTPEVSSVRDADRVIGLLQHHNISASLLVNRLSVKMVEAGEMMSKEDVMDILAIDLLGLIVEDPEIVVSGNQGTPVVLNEDAPAGQAYRRIAKRLCGDWVEVPSFEQKKGFFAKIFGR